MAMPGRAEVARRIAALVGEEVMTVTYVGSGWPALADVTVDGHIVPVAIYCGPVGLSHRGRDDVERRFQNPGSERPIVEIPGRIPLLIGLWESDDIIAIDRPLLVSADALRREGHATRFSVFASVPTLVDALVTGWAEGVSTTDESLRCFAPPLLPISIAADRDGAPPDMGAMRAAITGSGLLDETADAPAAARARRAGSALVRDARFARDVTTAYDGRCAMCGLGVGLVQAAHIYPVSAPHSPDAAWNGVALCANHHIAFDKHLVGIEPGTFGITLAPQILEQLPNSAAVKRFVEGTFERLATPANVAVQASQEMFESRYAFFPSAYEWFLSGI